jgi:hypothetical protein
MDAGPMMAWLKGEHSAQIVTQTLIQHSGECFAHVFNFAKVYYLFFRQGGISTAETAI